MQLSPRCTCLCHVEEVAQARLAREGGNMATAFYYAQEAKHYPGADVDDVIEAAVASGCACLPNHCAALLQRRIWAPQIVRRETVPTNSEGDE
jgi:hypothetical protein